MGDYDARSLFAVSDRCRSLRKPFGRLHGWLNPAGIELHLASWTVLWHERTRLGLKWLNLGLLPLDQTLTFPVDIPYAYSTDFWCLWHGLVLLTVPHMIQLVVHDQSYWASVVGFRHGVQFWSFANGLRQHMCDTWHCVSARIVQILHCSIQCQNQHTAIQGVRPSWTILKSRLCMHRQLSVLEKQLQCGITCSGQWSDKNGIDPHFYSSKLSHP